MRNSLFLLATLLFSLTAFADADVKPAGKLNQVEPKTVCIKYPMES